MSIQPLHLSIIIPVYNDEATIVKTEEELENYFSQCIFKKITIFLVENGSGDQPGFCQGQHDIEEGLVMICAVNNGGFAQFFGQGFEKTNQEEDGKG